MHNVAFEISTFPSLQAEVLDRIGGSWEVARISAAFDFASTHHKAPPLLIRELPAKNFSTSFYFWTWPCAGFFGRASLFAGCHVQCCSSSKPSNSQAALSADVKLWSFSSSKPSTSELLYLACCQPVQLCTTGRSIKLALRLTVSFKCTERTEWIIVQHLRWPFLLLLLGSQQRGSPQQHPYL